jgi:hypothetical protein
MRKTFAVLAVLVMASCAAMQRSNANGKVADPEVSLVQTSRVPDAAEYSTGGVPVSFRMDVTNRADVPITLKRVDVVSVGGVGGFDIPSTSHPFTTTIAPGGKDSVEFWVAGNATGQNVTGANEPVTVRVVATFDSSLGSLQNVTIQQVRASR